jgi:hypothetical protein
MEKGEEVNFNNAISSTSYTITGRPAWTGWGPIPIGALLLAHYCLRRFPSNEKQHFQADTPFFVVCRCHDELPECTPPNLGKQLVIQLLV